MTLYGRKFKISNLNSIDVVLEKAEALCNYPLKIDSDGPPTSVKFKNISGFVDISLNKSEKYFFLQSVPGEAPVLFDLLTLALLEIGAESPGGMPKLEVPLTREVIIQLNKELGPKITFY